ncbi:MAG: enoyl-CoA hydratase/isomerase family protein, partial [Planctomycetes bacterium]|nr:enoyl-CoA hydratase/isomerase family protein [Planctomycetota bacterium]
QAMRLMIEGKNVGFEEARDLGLVDEIIEAEDFQEAALDFARKYLPPHKASRSVGLIKRACVSGAEMSFEQGLALERELQQRLFVSDDAREGITAFNEKRSPRFTGK